MSPRAESDWTEAIAVADRSGDLSGIADLFLDPRVTEIDRAGLADLFSRKVLRDPSPAWVRRQRVREAYRAARADGLTAPAAEEHVAARLRVTTDFVHNTVNRGRPRRKTRRCAGSEPAA